MPSPAEQRQTYQLPPDKYDQAIQLNRQVNTLHFVSVAWTIVILLLMLRFGLAHRLAGTNRPAPLPEPEPVPRPDDESEAVIVPLARARQSRFPRELMAVTAILAILGIAHLPLDAYRHWLAVHYGLSVEGWAAWIEDWMKAGALTGAAAILITMVALAMARRNPKGWWVSAWVVLVSFVIGATYVLPVVVEPMFYDFRPLAQVHPELMEPLSQVAAYAGEPVAPERIFEMNASQKTRTLNAYMTGFGDTKRIVIWDTTAKILTPPQVQTVFAHEVGHYALGHIPRGILVAAGAMLLGLWALNGILTWMARRWGVASVADLRMLPVALLLITVGGFLAEPVANAYSRRQEHDADVFELRVMRALIPHAGRNSAQVDQIMAEISLDDPAPSAFIKFWLYDHPATDERMREAEEFAP